MNIYLVSQSVNLDYNTFDSFVVVAESEEVASKTHPDQNYQFDGDRWVDSDGYLAFPVWCLPCDVKVALIGKADESYTQTEVILASFNAG